MATRHIGFSLGDIGSLDQGLGEFALQIGSRLAQRAAQWRERYDVVLHAHVREPLMGLFGDQVRYIPVSRSQRWRHPQHEHFVLWHSLHQLNKTLAPAGTALRLTTVHDLNYRYGRNAFSSWRHHRRTKALLARSDALTAISAYTAADIRAHLHWRGDIAVIHNGARNFSSDTRQPLPGWGPHPERPFLLHLSRMSPSKNPQAMLALAAQWPQMHFVFAGPNNEDTRALKRAHVLPNVEFHLGINDAQKAWAYSACAAFLFPSLAEGFGLPPLEAMHFGKPVCLSRLTSLPEIGADLADYFDSFEPQAMRAVVEGALARYAADPQRADALRAHAAGFNWDAAGEAYAALYLRILNLGA
jgi:glycosyltransferase involved in cell wall biosynthesis